MKLIKKGLSNLKYKYILIAALLIVIGVALLIQKNTSTPSSNGLAQNKNGNLTLYVSNQSFDITPVDITVRIDGATAVSKSFEVGTQHNEEAFQFTLSNGSHKIDVSSIKGDAKLTKNFEIKGKRWAILDYWYTKKSQYNNESPKGFSFEISDKQPGFD